MKKFVLLLLILLSACAVVPKKGEIVRWPAEISNLRGEGSLDLKWKGEHLSGPFAMNMAYPGSLLFEVYGSVFGQTIVHLEKNGDKFLLIAGNEKSTDEERISREYGFGVRELMDGLAMKGERKETPEGIVIDHGDYRAVYGQDRKGRRTVCWEREDGRLCLTFTEVSFDEH